MPRPITLDHSPSKEAPQHLPPDTQTVPPREAMRRLSSSSSSTSKVTHQQSAHGQHAHAKWSHLVTKHGTLGREYSRFVECAGGGLQTRNPATDAVTNTWRIADVVDVVEEPRESTPDGKGRHVLRVRLAGGACCGLLPTILCVSSPSAESATALYRHLVQEMAREPSCMLLRQQLLERASAHKNRADSFSRRKQQLLPPAAAPSPAAAAGDGGDVGPAAADGGELSPEEQAAGLVLVDISDGSLCLARASLGGGTKGGSSATTASARSGDEEPPDAHAWRQYDGQRGSGRACEDCFMCQDVQGGITWALRPPPPPPPPPPRGGVAPPPPSAVGIFASWRAELDRCTTHGGCIAGGAHDLIDASATEIRLTGPGHCCRKCGMVVDAKSVGGDGCLVAEPSQRRILVLPNMLGQFGPAIRSLKAYRGELPSMPNGRLLQDPRTV